MKNEAVLAFRRALESVMAESGFQGVHIMAPVERSGTGPEGIQVSVSVGIAGAIRGFLFLLGGRSSATAYAVLLSEQMGVPLDTPETFGSMHKAALAELINQIGGRATILLAELGLDTDITPPTVVTGDSVEASGTETLPFLDFHIQAAAGELILAVGYQSAG